MVLARNPISTICRLSDLHPHHNLQVSQTILSQAHSFMVTTERPAGSGLHGPQRTMLQREYLRQRSHSELITKGRHLRTDAWHVVASTDPLVDSDEELMDEYVRNDYSESLESISQPQPLINVVDQRIAVIARLRGRAPTPPPDNVTLPNNVPDTREHRWRTVQSWK